MLSKLSPVSKAVAGFVGAAATWASTALADGGITSAEWYGLLAVLAGLLVVYLAPANAPAEPTPTTLGDGGLAELDTALRLALLTLAVVAILVLLGAI